MQTLDEVKGLHNLFSQTWSSDRAMQHRKKVFYCFYKLTFQWKNAKFFIMALNEREILTCHEVLLKRGFPKYGFFSLKMSALAKKIGTACFVKIFQVSADEGMGK